MPKILAFIRWLAIATKKGIHRIAFRTLKHIGSRCSTLPIRTTTRCTRRAIFRRATSTYRVGIQSIFWNFVFWTSSAACSPRNFFGRFTPEGNNKATFFAKVFPSQFVGIIKRCLYGKCILYAYQKGNREIALCKSSIGEEAGNENHKG